MYHLRRNKSELIVLTGAIYSFVAYLTAFTLEILFLIDLTRRSGQLLSSLASTTTSSGGGGGGGADIDLDLETNSSASSTITPFDRFNIESMQAHITIACLTISILYFIVFITSLILIVALILRSTFMLLIWMCAMTTMYLPEFGLVIYVSVYGWSLDTRNGQTEMGFYLIRAALNMIFIYRAHKLYKQWNYEKNFFRLKSGSGSSSAAASHFGANSRHSPPYDSPYFHFGSTGDSLSTTINPIFSTSTLNLNRYDFVRDQFNQHQHQHQQDNKRDTSGATSPTTNNTSLYGMSTSTDNTENLAFGRMLYSREQLAPNNKPFGGPKYLNRTSYDFDSNYQRANNAPAAKQHFYLGAQDLPPLVTSSTTTSSSSTTTTNNNRPPQQQRRSQPPNHHRLSMLSINDDYAEYELDLDYRTLGKPSTRQPQRNRSPASNFNRYSQQIPSTGQRFQPHLDDQLSPPPPPPLPLVANSRLQASANRATSRSHDDLAYSTQSLDRRGSRDFTLTEQVVLRPLGHQPFEYLHRPGSTTNLNNYN